MRKTLFVLTLLLSFALLAAEDIPALRGHIAELEKENQRLREELDALRIQATENAARLNELKIAVAGILDAGEIKTPERREEAMLLLLDEITRRGIRFALHTTDLIQSLQKQYRAMPADSTERAAMLLNLEQLEKESNTFVALLKPADTGNFTRPQILAVDRENRLVVIAVGSVHGIFPGIRYDVDNLPVRLRIIATRSFVSAAAIESGDAALINPGMRCTIREKREKIRQ